MHSQVSASFLVVVRVMQTQLRALVTLVFQPVHPTITATSHANYQQLHRQQQLALRAVLELSLLVVDQAEQIVLTPPPAAAGPPRRGNKRGRAVTAPSIKTASHTVAKAYDRSSPCGRSFIVRTAA